MANVFGVNIEIDEGAMQSYLKGEIQARLKERLDLITRNAVDWGMDAVITARVKALIKQEDMFADLVAEKEVRLEIERQLAVAVATLKNQRIRQNVALRAKVARTNKAIEDLEESP